MDAKKSTPYTGEDMVKSNRRRERGTDHTTLRVFYKILCLRVVLYCSTVCRLHDAAVLAVISSSPPQKKHSICGGYDERFTTLIWDERLRIELAGVVLVLYI